MAIRMVIGPLVSAVTYRRAVHLLLGGVLLLPYVLLGVFFGRMWTTPGTTRGATVLLVSAAAVIAAVPAFLRGTRALEITEARSLLDVDLPDPTELRPARHSRRETRLRASLWFALHLVFGGSVGLGLVLALPMGDLDRLFADTRTAGLAVTVEVTGPVDAVPTAMSREGYRIVQEALTNAVRHAGPVPVTVRLAVSHRALEIEVANPISDNNAVSWARSRTGRGLPGVHERVAILGGRMTTGADGGKWRVTVRLPLGRRA